MLLACHRGHSHAFLASWHKHRAASGHAGRVWRAPGSTRHRELRTRGCWRKKRLSTKACRSYEMTSLQLNSASETRTRTSLNPRCSRPKRLHMKHGCCRVTANIEVHMSLRAVAPTHDVALGTKHRSGTAQQLSLLPASASLQSSSYACVVLISPSLELFTLCLG